MEKRKFLSLLDELLDLDPGTVKESDVLADLEQWDSLAIIGFMALLDEHFGIRITAKQLSDCKTVSDLMKLPGERITDAASHEVKLEEP